MILKKPRRRSITSNFSANSSSSFEPGSENRSLLPREMYYPDSPERSNTVIDYMSDSSTTFEEKFHNGSIRPSNLDPAFHNLNGGYGMIHRDKVDMTNRIIRSNEDFLRSVWNKR